MGCSRAGAGLAPSAVPSLTRSVDFSLPKPEEAMAVPVGPRHRLGDLGQAAESLAIPGEALLQDHDPLEPALPFTNEQRASLQCDALPSLWGAPVEGDTGAIILLRLVWQTCPNRWLYPPRQFGAATRVSGMAALRRERQFRANSGRSLMA